MCAVGRYLENPKKVAGIFINVKNIVSDYHGAKLKKEVEDVPLHFWEALQCYHDTSNYWGDTDSCKEANAYAVKSIRETIHIYKTKEDEENKKRE